MMFVQLATWVTLYVKSEKSRRADWAEHHSHQDTKYALLMDDFRKKEK